MPQFRRRPRTYGSTPDPDAHRATTLAAIAKGLKETKVRPGEPAEITVGADMFVPHEDDGLVKPRRPLRNAPGSVVTTLLACHDAGDYDAALAEIDRFLSEAYVLGWTTVRIDEFSMQPLDPETLT
ncbi:hypothetical protein QFW96_10785 [Saccharopolyspora sp. TS4A08]|uniref:Uncharacterized protein n=1 Tax=Saccharopolyspora ipomoeae TaxID=3042027 RepID=A0ABT6PMB3_9PSEU|nr:hypothetical protein [Saccharopolyspora sp. TS4A08]MDI2029098.1 hypothetical protein [Saccharopolyspora sp. TS4A08]